nr:zinc finger, CCHC-type [Tanacetum cinerariifolium]
MESAKELWDSLESKYIADDDSSKKFLVSSFNNYKMVDYRPVMEQFNELLRILEQYTRHGPKIDESISVSKESLRVQESDKSKGKEVVGPSVNMMEEGGKNKNNKQNKGKKRGFKDKNGGSGIIHETTAPYTPQQNGVAEKKNRALKEMVNAMLSYSGLSDGFLKEAMLTACYLLNMVPYKRNKTTLYELWKLDGSGKCVIICLYVDDMLIFGTDQTQVDKTKKFLSSKFSMKDIREADVILGKHVDQLEYSRAIGCLMYAMTSTRPDIAYAVGRLSKFTSNSSRRHWHAITRINHVEDSSSTSEWVFLLRGGAISWASKKQTCITSFTMKSQFVALTDACEEAKWLRNLIHEILI